MVEAQAVLASEMFNVRVSPSSFLYKHCLTHDLSAQERNHGFFRQRCQANDFLF